MKPCSCVRPEPRYPMSRRSAGMAHDARALCACGRKAGLEAQEFHKFYTQGFVGFTAVAVVAHILVWIWRPWL
jgi:light-harvesting complex 1 beta chain